MLVFPGKRPIYLRGSCEGHATLVSIITLLHASTTMNELVMKGRGSHSRQQGSRMPAEADPWGSRMWQWARGGLQSPSSEVGPGELLAGEGLESRKLGGTLRGDDRYKSFYLSDTCLAPTVFHASSLTLVTTVKAGMAVSVLQKRFNEAP